MHAKKRNEKIIKLLIERRADVYKKNINDGTPLYIVCKIGNKNLVKLLVEQGADVNLIIRENDSPLRVIINKLLNGTWCHIFHKKKFF